MSCHLTHTCHEHQVLTPRWLTFLHRLLKKRLLSPNLNKTVGTDEDERRQEKDHLKIKYNKTTQTKQGGCFEQHAQENT